MFDGAVRGMTLRRIRPEMYNWWKWLPASIHAAGEYGPAVFQEMHRTILYLKSSRNFKQPASVGSPPL